MILLCQAKGKVGSQSAGWWSVGGGEAQWVCSEAAAGFQASWHLLTAVLPNLGT